MKKRNTQKLKVLDLFCGCGGLSSGFEQAGYQIIGGIDFNQAAIDTFNFNFHNAKGVCCDLLDIGFEKIKDYFGKITDVDVIIGGPPCQGFSSANRYQTGEDPRNKLFYEFVKFVDAAQPKVIVIENVRGIVTRDNGYAKNKIYEIFESRGYKVTHKILDASDYGVPQRRLRNFFVITKGFDFSFDMIHKKNIVTVEDAIGELYGFDKNIKETDYTLKNDPITSYRKYLRNKNNIVKNHEIKYPAEIVQERISYVKQGENWASIPKELFKNQRNNRHSSAYKRLKENDVSVTIDTGNAHSNYFHPLYNRIPTVREAARIQSFKDNFVFQGTRSAQYRQVGNAVPPLLAKAVATAILEAIDEEK